MKHERTVGVYDTLKPDKNVLNQETVNNFVAKKNPFEIEGKDNYMVIDNLDQTLSVENLRELRSEAEALTKTVCKKEQELGKRKLLD